MMEVGSRQEGSGVEIGGGEVGQIMQRSGEGAGRGGVWGV